MKTAILLTVASLATVLGASPKPAGEVKTDAAAGRYNRRGYDRPSYGSGYGYQQPIGYWQPLVQDRFVCDLDASVLLVVDSNRHHHNRHSSSSYGYGNPSVPANRAVRVKCSEVANHDIDSCNLCCQQTARRDTTLANDALFGFLAITKTDDDETFKRSKRGADEDDDDDESPEERGRRGKYHRVDSTYVSEADWSPPKYHSNVKCVCCAPRNNPAAQNPSTGYSNTASQSPPAASNPSYNSNTFSAVPAPSPVNTAAAQPLVDSWQTDSGVGNQGSWNSGAANTAATGNQGSWNSGAANTAAAASSGANWNSGASGAATSSDSSAWGAASDVAAPAPPPAAAVSTAPGNKY